jgi:DNA-binding NarL/FixJ family response regulator
LAALRVRQGRLEEADLLLRQIGETVETEAESALARAALSLARGDATAASRALEQRLHHLQAHRWHLAAALDLLVEAYVAVGDVDRGAETADRLAATAALASSEQLDALAASARGRVALARDDPSATAQLETALRLWSNVQLPSEVARARFELARALAPSRRELALDHARGALAAFDALGASVEADRVAAFLRSLGAVPRTGPKGVGVLTMREQDVLRLLGAGLSNPEIAERLQVSRKTASHHVSSILMKLNLRNRAEVAAYSVAALSPPGGL